MEIATIKNRISRRKDETFEGKSSLPPLDDRPTCANDIRTTLLCLRQLQEIVERVDRLSFFIREKRYQDILSCDLLRHDLFHLAKAVSKLAAWFEAEDHYVSGELLPILHEVVPDLIIYASQIANKFDLSLDDLVKQRLHFTLNKYSERF